MTSKTHQGLLQVLLLLVVVGGIFVYAPAS